MPEKNVKRQHVIRNLSVRFVLAFMMIPVLLFTSGGLIYFALMLIYTYFLLEPAYVHNAVSTFAFVFFLICTITAFVSVVRAMWKLGYRLHQQWQRYRTMQQEVARLSRLQLEDKRNIAEEDTRYDYQGAVQQKMKIKS